MTDPRETLRKILCLPMGHFAPTEANVLSEMGFIHDAAPDMGTMTSLLHKQANLQILFSLHETERFTIHVFQSCKRVFSVDSTQSARQKSFNELYKYLNEKLS